VAFGGRRPYNRVTTVLIEITSYLLLWFKNRFLSSPFYNRDPSVHPAQRELPPPPPKIYSPPQKYAWNSRNSQSPDKGEYARIKSDEKPVKGDSSPCDK
jgi:hypothetical protein